MIDVNLSGCKFITELPKLKAPNLENLDLSFCKNLVKFYKLRAPNLKNVRLYGCENLVKLPKCFGSLEKLKTWDLTNCEKFQILQASSV